jgi:hypothetical protein
MTGKEVLIYIIFCAAGILSIYALFDAGKGLKKDDLHTKIRNLIFYTGILLGVYGLYALIKIAVKFILKS